MYGWIGKSCYNHRVILTSTIEYDNFQRLRKFRLSEFFFYVILKLSIVRREKRMKKSKNLKGKIGAVMLSLVLALTMVVTPSMFTTKSVSADEETTENVESVRNIIPDREKVKKYEIPETRKLGKEEKEMPEPAKKKEKFRYSTAGQIWRLIYPFLIHYGATLLATIALYLVYLIQAGGLQETASAGQRLINSTLYVTLIGDLTAAMILYLFYRKDQMHRKEGFSGTGKAFVWAPPVIWFSVIILAIATGQFLNDLINGLHLNDLFTGYSEVSEQAFSGQPVGLMILVVGIIGPICEELMFRGIVFHRLKDWVKPQAAIVISALLFGIYHGNVVQFFYATCMGVMLAIIYDKTGTLWISIVAHIAANLWSLFGSSFWSSLWQQIPAGMLCSIMIEILLCVIPTYWLFGYKRKSKKDL